MKADRATKKRISTRAMMLLTGALTITTGFAVTIGVLSWQSGQAQHRLAEEYLQQIARSKAMEVEKSLNHARDVAQSLGQSLIAVFSERTAARSLLFSLFLPDPYLSFKTPRR